MENAFTVVYTFFIESSSSCQRKILQDVCVCRRGSTIGIDINNLIKITHKTDVLDQ